MKDCGTCREPHQISRWGEKGWPAMRGTSCPLRLTARSCGRAAGERWAVRGRDLPPRAKLGISGPAILNLAIISSALRALKGQCSLGTREKYVCFLKGTIKIVEK
jgi:hypothetical protein